MSYNHRGREPRPHRLEVRLSAAELESVNECCRRVDRSASSVVRHALELYIQATLEGHDAPTSSNTDTQSASGNL
jgi:hypothetical protein